MASICRVAQSRSLGASALRPALNSSHGASAPSYSLSALALRRLLGASALRPALRRSLGTPAPAATRLPSIAELPSVAEAEPAAQQLSAARSCSATAGLTAFTLREVTLATRVLDLSASVELVCDNMMCEKVGELCLCKFSIAFPKVEHIMELRLRSNGMDRWPEVWRIPGLRVLDVSDNRLASIPPEIMQLTQLEELRMCDNQIEGLPDELGLLPLLRFLDVRGNLLRSVPPSLAAVAILHGGEEGSNSE
ncbi:hypothetical protein T492DRAFT_612370, partial [Pavlovales sp. CCMP2436]|mmetsp:Transcript_3115/g.8219  ORF Transcript_3115/g.8219 Transcript_3115/m.8219 type:complete len:251 (+) Transcript_3115:1-753(+)